MLPRRHWLPSANTTPATGLYVGPDGRQYTQSELAQPAKDASTWQSMLLPGQP